MKTVTCCQRNGHAENGCNEGRLCPEGRVDLSAILTRRVSPEEMTRRQQEAEYLWTRELGVEAADAARVTGSPPIVTAELREVPSFWQRVGFACVVALCLLWAAIAVWG